jgi:hypothetical protein
MTTIDDDALAAALLQLADHGERLAELSERGHDFDVRLGELVQEGERKRTHLDAITEILGHHAAAVTAIEGIDRQVAQIATRLSSLTASSDGPEPERCQSAPTPRWWRFSDTEREDAVARLLAWVEQVYQPGYGHLAAALPPCWEYHPLCLYTLDWLSELWSALHLEQSRTASTLAAEAEWQTRLLPAATSQMSADARNCRNICRLQPST